MDSLRENKIVVSHISKKYKISLSLGMLVVWPIRDIWNLLKLMLGGGHRVDPELKDVSFTIPAGTVVGFLGPNGAGKTTTMRVMTKLLTPDRGKVEIDGNDMLRNYPVCLRNMGTAVGDPVFYSYLTGFENLKVLSFFYSGVDDERIRELLGKVGLSEHMDKKFSNYSSGMKKRMVLASTMLQNPEILLLDEPTSGMDPRGRVEFRKMIKELNSRDGVTVFISSHEIKELEDICDYLVIIEDGRIKLSDKISAIREKFESRDASCDVVIYTDVSDEIEKILEKQDYVFGVERGSDFYLVKMKKSCISKLPVLFVENKIELRGFHEEKSSIEDIYLKTTKSGE
jgi:ABC-2 type transport system ATP-binding protein